MRYFLLSIFGAAALLAGCETSTPDSGDAAEDLVVSEEQTLDKIELCDAADYRPLIGSNIAATTLPRDPMIRAYGVNDIITQEYLPQRTNIVFDTDGVIVRVWCG